MDEESITIRTITLSDTEPHQTSAGPSGTAWQAGEQATICQDVDGSFSYVMHGIGEGGNYGEGDPVEGFASADEAEQAARDAHADMARHHEEEAAILAALGGDDYYY